MSTSLDELLKKTLLFSANKKPYLVTAENLMPIRIGKTTVHQHGHSHKVKKVLSQEEIQNLNIWKFDEVEKASVVGLWLYNRTMGNKRVSVCKRIDWGDVKVIHEGKGYDLPLDEKFLIRTHFLEDASIPASEQGFWQLPMNIDFSLQKVFAYEIYQGQIRPLDEKEIDSPQLMEGPVTVSAFNMRTTGQRVSIRAVPPLRIIVCMTLGCMKERNDFEPGGVLGAARLMPHFMIVANSPVDRITASISLVRESKTAETEMDGDQMTPDIGSAFFTDRNTGQQVMRSKNIKSKIIPVYPLWDIMFEYYNAEPKGDLKIKAVRRDRTTARGKDKLVEYFHVAGIPPYNLMETYFFRNVKKVPYQGEFDSIHIAPKLKLPEVAKAALPKDWPSELTMAPFCVHDCLHTHWRWGSDLGLGNKWVYGFSGDVPYKMSGAPLVPSNQDVTVEMLGPSSFKYTATAYNPAPGSWQVIMHHGSAYAISYTGAVEFGRTAVEGLTGGLPTQYFSGSRWAFFYWHLRYNYNKSPLPSLYSDRYNERLRWTSERLRAAQEL